MPNIEVQLPAGIGEPVMLAGQPALVVAWRLVRSTFLLGGALDRAPEVSLLVRTEDGQEHWFETGEVAAPGAPVRVTFFLSFTGGDAVLVNPSRSRGEVVGWEFTGQPLGLKMTHRVHLAGTAAGAEIEVDVRDLEPWAACPRLHLDDRHTPVSQAATRVMGGGAHSPVRTVCLGP